MANWKHTLDIEKEWEACENKEISLKQLIEAVITKLKLLQENLAEDEELEEIIDEFGYLHEEKLAPEGHATEESQQEDFNSLWGRLYDWADQEVAPFGAWPANKMCWVKVH